MMYLFGVIVQVNSDHQIARPHLRNTLQSLLARAPTSLSQGPLEVFLAPQEAVETNTVHETNKKAKEGEEEV